MTPYNTISRHRLAPYKSAGERRIAEFLNQNHLRFTYEKPLAVIDEGLTKIFHPDYSLHDFSTIIEYFGISNNQDYAERSKRKMKIYTKNNIPVIPIYPQDFERDYWKGKIIDFLHWKLEYQKEVLNQIVNSNPAISMSRISQVGNKLKI